MTKNLGQKMVFRRKPIVILKEQNMAYHPSLISIFDFLTKIDFFRVGGGLQAINYTNIVPYG